MAKCKVQSAKSMALTRTPLALGFELETRNPGLETVTFLRVAPLA